jgi:hypothetical protein
MKTILAAILLSLALAAQAANPLTNLLSLAYVNGTNNGGVYYASNIIVPLQKFTLQSLGITNVLGGSYTTNGVTNRITAYLQWSVDPANATWVTIATYAPTTTNATVENINSVIGQIAIPMRLQIVTTNAIGVATFTSP